MFIERHCHYTGSLPMDFLISQFLDKRDEIEDSTAERLLPNYRILDAVDFHQRRQTYQKIVAQNLGTAFTDDWRLNKRRFDEIYSLFQTLSRSNDPEQTEKLYSDGSYAIAQSFYRHHSKHIEIKAGPRKDLDSTCRRVHAMHKGLSRFENESGLNNFAEITLTFMRKEGVFQNYDPDSLTGIFMLLEAGKLPRVNGFDFSGDETEEGSDTLFEIISEIEKFNKFRAARSLHTYIVTVHAGEEFVNIDPAFYIEFFSRLLVSRIDRVGHGTFLWIPHSVFETTPDFDRDRRALLDLLARRNIELELCPTSNLLLTPLKDIGNIPISYFRQHRIPFSINTDNCTIFSTDIAHEHRLIYS